MAFATTDDIATRLGRSLTTDEAEMAQQVIDLVTGQIATAVGRDTTWASALTPVPAYFKALCIEKAIAVGTNPNNLASESEQIGVHQRSRTFQRANDGGAFLSDDEQRAVRFAYFGRNIVSVPLGSIFQEAE